MASHFRFVERAGNFDDEICVAAGDAAYDIAGDAIIRSSLGAAYRETTKGEGQGTSLLSIALGTRVLNILEKEYESLAAFMEMMKNDVPDMNSIGFNFMSPGSALMLHQDESSGEAVVTGLAGEGAFEVYDDAGQRTTVLPYGVGEKLRLINQKEKANRKWHRAVNTGSELRITAVGYRRKGIQFVERAPITAERIRHEAHQRPSRLGRDYAYSAAPRKYDWT